MCPHSRWKNWVKVTMVLALLCLVSVHGSTKEEKDTLAFLPHWKKGDQLNYEMIKTRQKAQGNKTIFKTTAKTDIKIEVTSATKDGYVLSWTFGETKLDNIKSANNLLFQKMSNLLKGHRVLFELDSKAVIKGVQNWQELRDRTGKLINTLAKELRIVGLDDMTIRKLTTEVSSMFASKQQIEQLCIREAQLFFLVVGVEFTGTEAVEYQDMLPNPFGGNPFPSRARFNLKQVDKQLGVAKISWSQTVDPEVAAAVMEKTLVDLSNHLGKPVSNSERPKQLLMEDRAEFIIDVVSSWIRKMTYTRVVKVDETSQEDTITITRKI